MRLTIIPLNKGFLVVDGKNAEAAEISGLQEKITKATHQMLGSINEIKEASVIVIEVVPLSEANVTKVEDANPFLTLFGGESDSSKAGFILASTKSQSQSSQQENKPSQNSGGNNSDKPIRR